MIAISRMLCSARSRLSRRGIIELLQSVGCCAARDHGSRGEASLVHHWGEGADSWLRMARFAEHTVSVPATGAAPNKCGSPLGRRPVALRAVWRSPSRKRVPRTLSPRIRPRMCACSVCTETEVPPVPPACKLRNASEYNCKSPWHVRVRVVMCIPFHRRG